MVDWTLFFGVDTHCSTTQPLPTLALVRPLLWSLYSEHIKPRSVSLAAELLVVKVLHLNHRKPRNGIISVLAAILILYQL